MVKNPEKSIFNEDGVAGVPGDHPSGVTIVSCNISPCAGEHITCRTLAYKRETRIKLDGNMVERWWRNGVADFKRWGIIYT